MNRRQIFRWAFLLLVIMGLAAVAVLPFHPYSGEVRCWMGELPDDTPIAAMTIPGTHDSGALHSFADAAGKCQSLTIADQLDTGVRFLDIRLRLKQDSPVVVHDFVDQGLSFAAVLEDMTAFISENPSEFLLLSIKQDAAPLRSTRSFPACVEGMLKDREDLFCFADTLPETLGEARGKIFVIARYENASIGIPAYHGWADNTSFPLGQLYVQDYYQLQNVSDKLDNINAAFAAADGNTLVLNFTSGYLTYGFPPLYAATPARQIHPWLFARLTEPDPTAGVLICDFMTEALANAIIGRNFS